MISIVAAGLSDCEKIREIAYTTWPITFGGILSTAQISYMLNQMYSAESLINQMMDKGHRFFLAREKNKYCGFISFESDYGKTSKTKIHKIYILPSAQGMGIGKALIHVAMEAASDRKNYSLSLNVNKNNLPAINFYKNIGFEIKGMEDIPIGNGYWMEDVVMERDL